MIHFIVSCIVIYGFYYIFRETLNECKYTRPIYIWLKYGNWFIILLDVVAAWVTFILVLFMIGMFEYGHWFIGLLMIVVNLICGIITFAIGAANWIEANQTLKAVEDILNKQNASAEDSGDGSDGEE